MKCMGLTKHEILIESDTFFSFVEIEVGKGALYRQMIMFFRDIFTQFTTRIKNITCIFEIKNFYY